MNVCLSVNYDTPFKMVADITVPRLAAYCSRSGYMLQVTQDAPITRSIVWDRIPRIQHLMQIQALDWIVHVDADVLVTNPKILLHQLLESVPADKHVVISKDVNGFNDGVSAYRRSVASKELLGIMWDMYGRPGVLCAQDSLRDLCLCGGAAKLVHVVEQRLINAYIDNWQPGDFVLHLPGHSNEKRVEIFSDKIKC